MDSLRESGAIEVVRTVPKHQQLLPMKLVTTVKPVEGSEIKKKKARVIVCGNFQQKSELELLCTANTDVSSIRCALAIAAQHTGEDGWGVSSLDINTAFLNTPLPEKRRTVLRISTNDTYRLWTNTIR